MASQGVPKVDMQMLLSRQGQAASTTTKSGNQTQGSTVKTSEEMHQASNVPDPTIYCSRWALNAVSEVTRLCRQYRGMNVWMDGKIDS